MDQQLAADAGSPDEALTVGNIAHPSESAAPHAAPGRNTLRQTLINLLPPIHLAAVIIFWIYAPKAWADSSWTVITVGLATTAIVQLLEFAFERHAGWRINWREFLTDLFYVALSYTVIGWTVTTLADNPLGALKGWLGISTPWTAHMPMVAQAFMIFALFEFGQYWMHRLMHNWTPFWLTHAPHHHITQLNAMKGFVGNPIELFLIGLSIIALFDLDNAAIFLAANMGGVISTYAHANVRANPPAFYSFFFTTIRHHSLHHSVPYEDTRCNYGNSLILIDRILGTYREGEADVVGQDDRKRLSIREQFMFPFTPMIEWVKAKRNGAAPAAG